MVRELAPSSTIKLEDMPINHSKEHQLIREDIAKVEKQIEAVVERLNQVPTRDEFPALLEKAFSFATLKAEHDRMKKIIREKLQVDV